MVFQMYGFGLVFLAVAAVAALFGFGVVSDDFPLMGKMCAAFFLLAAAAAFGWAWMNRSRAGGGRVPRRRPGTRWSAMDDVLRQGREWGSQ